MNNIKSSINLDKVKKFITRTINDSQDKSYVDHFSIYDNNVQVHIQGRIDFTTLNKIKEEMQDKDMKVSPVNQDTIVISFDVNGCYYRDYELPVLDLKPLDEYKDNLLQVGNYKYEEVFKDGRYNYFYTYRDDKIKDYASQHYEHSIKDFYCLVKRKPSQQECFQLHVKYRRYLGSLSDRPIQQRQHLGL